MDRIIGPLNKPLKIWWEDFEDFVDVKDAIDSGFGKPFNEEQIRQYVLVTRDDYPSHTNRRYMVGLGFSDICVPTHLLTGRLEGILKENGIIYMGRWNIGYDVRIMNPVFPGQRLRVVDEVEKVRRKFPKTPKAGLVILNRKAINEDGDLVVTVRNNYIVDWKC